MDKSVVFELDEAGERTVGDAAEFATQLAERCIEDKCRTIVSFNAPPITLTDTSIGQTDSARSVALLTT